MRSVVALVVLVALVGLLPLAGQDGSFDAEWQRLKRGREYGPAKTGSISYQFATVDGVAFETDIDVPASYDPVRKWPVRVQLHGGVSRPLERRRPRAYPLAPSNPEITVYPRGWTDAQWWHANQVDNILRVLDRLKREYNVDESRVYVTGFSDGATGAFFFGMRAPTPFCAIMPLHGSVAVLAHPATRADGQMYPANLVNRPLFATNGARDPLYPAAAIMPMMTALERAGVEMMYLPLPDAGHDLSWWPAGREYFEKFLAQHPRKPHPARLSWETERTDRYNRVDWLVITALGKTTADQPLDDVNPGGFPRARPSGRLDVVRTGNTFEARTRGVRRFMLLLSPDAIDFARPVKVVVNGRTVFDGNVVKDRATLRRWADRDNDRDVLYAAELNVEVQ
jgi:predicted esterase